MGAKFKQFMNELKNVKTVGLAYIADNLLEKFFWVSIGLLGIAWGFYLIPSNVDVWINNPSIVTKSNMNLSQIQYPAITIKSPGITKYAILERLINYVRPDKLPLKLRQLRTILLKCATDQDIEMKTDRKYFAAFQNECVYNFSPTQTVEKACKVLITPTSIQKLL